MSNEAGLPTKTARQAVTDYLTGEVWGPDGLDPEALPLPLAGEDDIILFPKDLQGIKYFDPETNEMVLQGIRPELQFGTGVLHAPSRNLDLGQDEKDFDLGEDSSLISPDAEFKDPETELSGSDDGDFALDQSQKQHPSALGFTAQLSVSATPKFKIEFSLAVYHPFKVQFETYAPTTWWKIQRLKGEVELAWDELGAETKLHEVKLDNPQLEKLLRIQIRWRNTSFLNSKGETLRAITFVAVHRGSAKDPDLFQSQLNVTILNDSSFEEVDRSVNILSRSEEEQEIGFLYRKVRNPVIGHGTAAEFVADDSGAIKQIKTIAIPKFFGKVLTTEVDGKKISMLQMAEADKATLKSELQELIDGYQAWIQANNVIGPGENPNFQKPLDRMVAKAEHIRKRMQEGLDLLVGEKDPLVLEAFQIANKAMYLQQINGKRDLRKFSRNSGPLSFDKAAEVKGNLGIWRPFQIAFLLMTLPGLTSEVDPSRDEVDLIYFPTGGGKTEAYLGAAATLIAHRRLKNQDHIGVDVIMRYTLRLLTVQQFERSAGLITALEYLRRTEKKSLGTTPISIGVWVGGDTTKNRRADVVDQLKKHPSAKEGAKNPFILGKCPWCSAEFGYSFEHKSWVGFKQHGSPATLKFVCSDRSCEFSTEQNPLPVWIVDDDVYDQKPSFVIGTVDKFAQLAWQPKSRAIFNIDSAGEREGLPPGLLIQDELHLISGPLGSMVGLYEPAIEELCSYEVNGTQVRPKIVASTATTKRYEEQIAQLYGRPNVSLFPQSLKEANETYFSSVLREADGRPAKGTLYLGLNPATYQNGQMSASKVAAILTHAPFAYSGNPEDADYYKTSTWFFNSLKELGMTLTLLQSVVIDTIRGMAKYRRLPQDTARWPSPYTELTSRVDSTEVADLLSKLQIKSSDEKNYIRTCLASSIMEVGVDVQRLGLLTIMGQPKSTSQYIQVSGRVGRDRERGPGLVVMLYNTARSRDRSIYEQFTNFHELLYANVEPISVTPFAIQAMRQGLYGAVISLYRALSDIAASATHLDNSKFEEAVEVLRSRMNLANEDPRVSADFEQQIDDLRQLWLRYEPAKWDYSREQEDGKSKDQDTALMRKRRESLGQTIEGDDSIRIPTSMRNVDGQTQLLLSANPYSHMEVA
jgi:hypothetical protein